MPPPPAPPRRTALPPRPFVRAAPPDAPPPPPRQPLILPPPRQLGIGLPRAVAAPLDWTDARRRMQALGITSFFLQTPPDGGCCFTCWLPAGTDGASQHIEARAATEAEAVRLGLRRAEQLGDARH